MSARTDIASPKRRFFRARLLERFEDVLNACVLFSDTVTAYCSAVLKQETDPIWW